MVKFDGKFFETGTTYLLMPSVCWGAVKIINTKVFAVWPDTEVGSMLGDKCPLGPCVNFSSQLAVIIVSGYRKW